MEFAEFSGIADGPSVGGDSAWTSAGTCPLLGGTWRQSGSYLIGRLQHEWSVFLAAQHLERPEAGKTLLGRVKWLLEPFRG